MVWTSTGTESKIICQLLLMVWWIVCVCTAEGATDEKIWYGQRLADDMMFQVTASIPDTGAMRALSRDPAALGQDIREVRFQLVNVYDGKALTLYSFIHRPKTRGFAVLHAVTHQSSIFVAVLTDRGLAVIHVPSDGMVSTQWLKDWTDTPAAVPLERDRIQGRFIVDGDLCRLETADRRDRATGNAYLTTFEADIGEFRAVAHRITDSSGRELVQWGAGAAPSTSSANEPKVVK